MTDPNKSQLYERVANALADKPSQQPVHKNAAVGEVGVNDQKKANSKKGMGNTKLKNVNAFSFNKSYPVSIIHKAQAKLG